MREIENKYKLNQPKKSSEEYGGHYQDEDDYVEENEDPNERVHGFKNYTNERFNMEEARSHE
jgi:hypothetical protein